MRAHRLLRWLVVGAIVVLPASVPTSAIANSAFDQYVEVPPDSGSENTAGPGITGSGTGNGGTGRPTRENGPAKDLKGGSSDPMVAWATGQAPAVPAGTIAAADGSAVRGGTGEPGAKASSAEPLIGSGATIGDVSAGGPPVPVALFLAMGLSLVLVAGVGIFSRRQSD